MTVKKIITTEFKELIHDDSSVIVVDAYADWCGPLCSQILASTIGANVKKTESKLNKLLKKEVQSVELATGYY